MVQTQEMLRTCYVCAERQLQTRLCRIRLACRQMLKMMREFVFVPAVSEAVSGLEEDTTVFLGSVFAPDCAPLSAHALYPGETVGKINACQHQ